METHEKLRRDCAVEHAKTRGATPTEVELFASFVRNDEQRYRSIPACWAEWTESSYR